MLILVPVLCVAIYGGGPMVKEIVGVELLSRTSFHSVHFWIFLDHSEWIFDVVAYTFPGSATLNAF